MATSTARYRILGVEHAAILKPVVPATTPPSVAEHDLHFINNVGFDVQQQDIAFEGDQQSVRKYFLNGVTINVACDTFDVKAVSEAFNKQVVTTGLPTGIDGRLYFGDVAETSGVKVGIVAQIRAENLTTQLMETLRFVVPVGSLTVVRPPTLAYNAKAQLNLVISGEKTTTDIALQALPGVPTDGCFWYLDNIAT